MGLEASPLAKVSCRSFDKPEGRLSNDDICGVVYFVSTSDYVTVLNPVDISDTVLHLSNGDICQSQEPQPGRIPWQCVRPLLDPNPHQQRSHQDSSFR